MIQSILHGIWIFLEPMLYGGVFVLVFFLAKSCWMFWHEEKYKHNIKWLMLEIKVPRETLRGPKAMEQVFRGVFNLRNSPVGPKETYWDGEITRWYSFEILGEHSEMRLFVRMPIQMRHPFTSTFYAHYPDIEIIDVEKDYIDRYPATYQELKKQGYEIYVVEVAQKKDPAYSLHTYVDYDSETGDEKGRILDSMASINEIIGKMKDDETLWIQFLTIPDTKEHWVHGANEIIKKSNSATQGGEHGGHGGDGAPIRLRFRTQGEEKTLKRIEEKKGIPCYETIIRYVYIAPKKIYNKDLANRGVFGYLAQFSNDDQRLYKPIKVRTKADGDAFPFIFPNKRLFWKSVHLYKLYRERAIPEETLIGKLYNSNLWHYDFFHEPMILSSRELATLFHIPTNVVMTQVAMDRIESKKLAPPSNLPN